MSDFFYELAAKNLGTADVIVPRRPALFESTLKHAHFQSFSEPESSSTFDDVNVVESRPATRPQRRSETAEGSVFPSRDADRPSSPISRKTFRDSENEPSSRSISSSSEIDARSRDLDRFRPREVPGESSKLIDQPKGHGSIVDPKLPPIRVFEKSTASESRKRERNNETVEAKTPIIAEPRVAIRRDREGERPRASSNVASKFPGEQPEKSEAPVINITIGRVEVRALPPSAPSRAAKAQPPAVSLDEFLQRRRNGGAR